MQGDHTAKEIARWTALGALFLIPLAPLIVADSYFFPFITGKAFYFRILVEAAFVAWAALAFLDKEYRPRFSWIGVAVLAFVAWMFIADLFAPNAAKAFWSNFERMEGWVLLAHLLGFFFAASAVLRVGSKWRAWFLTSLGVSVAVSAYALLQLAGVLTIHQGSTRIDASFGNSAYLAVYLLFNVFIALWLAFSEGRPWLKRSLLALAALEAVLIFFTETRGTILGLAGALVFGAILFSVTAERRPAYRQAGSRRISLAILSVIVVLAGSMYLARDSSFVEGNHTLERIASISLSDGQTRFTIWNIALAGARERPILGWGQEGFNYIFNKQYDPSLYGQEPWFDRAHNAFMDWLTAGGVPAFLLYVSLFASALVLLWWDPKLPLGERIALSAALVGYACHNLFVFDNLYSYVYFFALLALIDSQTASPVGRLERLPKLEAESGMTYAIPFAAVALVALVWSVNVPGMCAASGLIAALTSSAESPASNIRAFQSLVNHPAFAAQEIREQLVSFASSVAQSAQASDEEKREITALAIREMQKQVDAYPRDARERLQLAYAYRAIGDGAAALKEVRRAAELSPRKEQILIEAGALEWNQGDVQAARADFAAAYALGPQFPDLAAYAAAGAVAAGDQPSADRILQEAYGTTTVVSDVLAVAYYQTKNWPRLIALGKARTEMPGAGPEAWFSLASAQYAAGDTAGAVRSINRAVELFPETSASAAAALEQIRSGTVGQ